MCAAHLDDDFYVGALLDCGHDNHIIGTAVVEG